MKEYKPIPATTDKEHWGDAAHTTVDLNSVKHEPINLGNTKRRGGYLVLDGGNIAVAVDWKKYEIRNGQLCRKQ